MIYAIGALVFLAGAVLYVTTSPGLVKFGWSVVAAASRAGVVLHTTGGSHRSRGTLVVVYPPKRSRKPADKRQRRRGSQGSGGFYAADDGKGWQGPAEGEKLAKYAKQAAVPWIDKQMELHGEFAGRNLASLDEWHHDNIRVTRYERRRMARIDEEWAAFLREHGYTSEEAGNEAHDRHADV